MEQYVSILNVPATRTPGRLIKGTVRLVVVPSIMTLSKRVLNKVYQRNESGRILLINIIFLNGYQSVSRYVRHLKSKGELPFRVLHSLPGEEAQIDFGQGAWVIDENGKRRDLIYFVLF